LRATRVATVDKHEAPSHRTDWHAFKLTFCWQMRFVDEGKRTLSRLVHWPARCHEIHRHCMGCSGHRDGCCRLLVRYLLAVSLFV